MSDFYALEVIEKAIEDTKKLFKPFSFKNWLKMVLLMVFVGGGLNSFFRISDIISDLGEQVFNLGAQTDGSIAFEGVSQGVTGFVGAQEFTRTGLFALLIISFFGIVIAWIICSRIMEFVFVKICETKKISILNNFKSNIKNGLSLFGFNVLMFLFTILLITIPFGLFFLGIEPIPVIIISILIILPFMIVLSLVSMFTIDFVIVRMLDKEKNLIESWKDVLKMLRDEWKQTIVYILMKIALGIVTGIITFILLFVLMIPILLIGVFLAIITYLIFTNFTVLGIIMGVLSGLIVLLILLLVLLSIEVLIQTFFRYFSIRVYEKFSDIDFVKG